jgi:hypothetical protein
MILPAPGFFVRVLIILPLTLGYLGSVDTVNRSYDKALAIDES